MNPQGIIAEAVRSNRTLAIVDFRTPGIAALDLLLLLAEQKRMIGALALAGALLAGLYTLSLRDTYTATAVIALPQQQRSTIANLVGQFSPAGAVMGGGPDLLKNPAELYISLMSSRTVTEAMVADFGLQQRYGAKSKAEARQGLSGRTHFSAGKDFLIRISVDAGEAPLAAALANAYVDRLHKMNSHLALTESAQRRRFYEQRLQSQKQAVVEAENAMKATQERTGLMQVNSQMDAAVRTIAQLRAEMAAREVRLETLRAGATEKNPEVVRVRVELDSLREQLRRAESGAGGGGAPRLGTATAPAAGLAYLRSLREFQYHENLFESLSKQYEAARLDEAKEAPLVQVVDPAVAPEERNPKRRVWIVLFGAASFGVLGACLALFRHLASAPENAAKLAAIGQALGVRTR